MDYTDAIWSIIREPVKPGELKITVMKSRHTTAERPDVRESAGGRGVPGPFFRLKAHGEVLTARASEALFWVTNSGRPHRVEQMISRNETWLWFDRNEDAALFKLFWL